jgi:hypothetical protein
MTQPPAPLRRAPQALAAVTIALAVVVAALQVAVAVAALRTRGTVEALYGPDPTALDWIVTATFAALIAAYVVSCLWLQRARTNARLISPGVAHQRSSVWVWLGWVVPIVNLWFPYQVVRDIRNGSVRLGQTVGVGLWWTAWLVYLLVPRAIHRLQAADARANIDLNPDVDAFPVADVLTAVMAVVACALWCTLVAQITAAQKAALNGATPPGPPAAGAPSPGAPRPVSPALPPVPPRWSPHGD